ncbi:MAG: CBS domain-containing protein [Thermoanaerobaculaceae bacterium]|jgi:CBS domain-containing protein|nr:CBS domain-containing protein [Thermoanaerobaculaceae bacterium]
MDTIATVLEEKGSRHVITVSPNHTVREAVKVMCEARVGAVLVCEERSPCGILSERDLMVRVILAGRNPDTTPVREVMTAEVACIRPDASVDEAMAIMTDRRCRHLPVVQEGELVGLVSIGDLVRHESQGQKFVIRMLTDYVTGKYPG